jgi:hypothetical protein
MNDYNLACRKAIKKVWSAAEFTFGMFSYHAWNAWVRNKKRMGEEFEAYKRSS